MMMENIFLKFLNILHKILMNDYQRNDQKLYLEENVGFTFQFLFDHQTVLGIVSIHTLFLKPSVT